MTALKPWTEIWCKISAITAIIIFLQQNYLWKWFIVLKKCLFVQKWAVSEIIFTQIVYNPIHFPNNKLAFCPFTRWPPSSLWRHTGFTFLAILCRSSLSMYLYIIALVHQLPTSSRQGIISFCMNNTTCSYIVISLSYDYGSYHDQKKIWGDGGKFVWYSSDA